MNARYYAFETLRNQLWQGYWPGADEDYPFNARPFRYQISAGCHVRNPKSRIQKAFCPKRWRHRLID